MSRSLVYLFVLFILLHESLAKRCNVTKTKDICDADASLKYCGSCSAGEANCKDGYYFGKTSADRLTTTGKVCGVSNLINRNNPVLTHNFQMCCPVQEYSADESYTCREVPTSTHPFRKAGEEYVGTYYKCDPKSRPLFEFMEFLFVFDSLKIMSLVLRISLLLILPTIWVHGVFSVFGKVWLLLTILFYIGETSANGLMINWMVNSEWSVNELMIYWIVSMIIAISTVVWHHMRVLLVAVPLMTILEYFGWTTLSSVFIIITCIVCLHNLFKHYKADNHTKQAKRSS